MAHLFFGPFYPTLERRLVEELSAAQDRAPLSPLLVIVPTRPIKRRLQSILAEQGAWVNVHFHTIHSLAVTSLVGAGRTVRPTPPRAAFLLLLRQVIQTHTPPNEHTRYFLAYDSCLDILLGLFARFTSFLAEEPPGATEIEHMIFALRREYGSRKKSLGLRDREDLVAAAADLLEERLPETIPQAAFLYGFYDLNPLQKKIISALAKNIDLTILSPGGFSEGAEEFFTPTVSFYRRLAEENETTPVISAQSSIPLKISRLLFGPGPRHTVEAGDSLGLITAAGDHGEARAIALQIIERVQADPNLRWRDIGVAVRSLDDVRDIFTDAFRELSIPAFIDGGIGLSYFPEARYAAVLISAIQGDLPRKDIVFLLSSALFSWPGLSPDDRQWVRDNAYLIEVISKRYRVVSGKKDWEAAFAAHEKRSTYNFLSDTDEDDGPQARLRQAITRMIATIKSAVTSFLDALTNAPENTAPGDLCRYVRSLLDTYIYAEEPSPGLEKLYKDIEAVCDISSVQERISRIDYFSLLAEEIAANRIIQYEDTDAVFVSDVMGIRGLSFDLLFVAGMNEKVFPRAFRTDPILSERTGRTMGLPSAESRLLEDRTLFALTTASARNVLIISRRHSDDAGRIVPPSPFVREILSHVTIHNAVIDPVAPPSGTLGREYPRLTAADDTLSQHTGIDRRVNICLSWPDNGDVRKVRGVISRSPMLAQGVTSLEFRSPNRSVSIYDGRIGNVPGILDTILPLSSNKLETYAACPFDFFMQYVLSARQEDDETDDLDAQPRELGMVYHRALRDIFDVVIRGSLFSPDRTSAEDVGRLVETFVPSAVEKGLSGLIPRLVLRARLRHACFIIGRLMENQRLWAQAEGWGPLYLEAVFGRGGLEPGGDFTVSVGDRTLRVTGRIDRIDVNTADGSYFVVDYKRRRPSGEMNLAGQIQRGLHFQLPLYLMAAQSLFSDSSPRPGGGALLYLDYDDAKDSRQELSEGNYLDLRDAVTAHIGAIVENIQNGNFMPVRGKKCMFCACQDLCRVAARGKMTEETPLNTEGSKDHADDR